MCAHFRFNWIINPDIRGESSIFQIFILITYLPDYQQIMVANPMFPQEKSSITCYNNDTSLKKVNTDV